MKIRIGLGSCGIAAGGKKVKQALVSCVEEKGLNIEITSTGCIGMCFYEPLVDVIDDKGEVYTYANVTADIANEIVEQHIINGTPIEKYIVATSKTPFKQFEKQVRVVLHDCGVINPEKIEDYLENDGYKALEKCINEMTPDGVIDEIKKSGLRGRGGAGFPTWFKWDAARKSKGNEKYVVCNADEGDPGAFMDRSVLEGDPHELLEGMIIAGYAIGANYGFIYCRAEYPLAIERLEGAIAQAHANNYLGENILGSDFNFDIKIKDGRRSLRLW